MLYHYSAIGFETNLPHDSRVVPYTQWLNKCNAFGSVPFAVLEELFTSLPIPEDLRRILVDIYSGNRMDFAVGKESVSIFPTAGVRQGYAFSATIFNMASEPFVKAGKSCCALCSAVLC
ncbi:Uncharacterized protein APZ42_005080 [Daphnia magna]|uniref:Uncharacterized protein n=1 Tax=Daphnia magna TaxID=35525 RepID=A0A162CU25_9CRUS|nr:Uncharacterized protein APZ42_005080 [Daphnia magna]